VNRHMYRAASECRAVSERRTAVCPRVCRAAQILLRAYLGHLQRTKRRQLLHHRIKESCAHRSNVIHQGHSIK
jgi:uncharacterized membrane-anchored protein